MTVQAHLYHWLWGTLDALFPPRCAGCGRKGTRWCEDCQRKVQVLKPPLCPRCGEPGFESLCPSCRQQPPAFTQLRAWSLYADPIRTAIHQLKYRRNLGLGEALALPLADFVRSLNWPVEAIVPIPLSQKRYQERGYNQVATFAYPLALHLGLPYLGDALHRTRDTRSQVGLSAHERRENVHNAFQAREKLVRGKQILLVDDVATTGSTLSSAANALLIAGAQAVYAVTLARANSLSLGGTYDA
jgi:ComF family protein